MAEAESSARAGMRSVTHGTVLMLLGTLVYVGATFLTRVVLVRTLPPDQWSDFAFALALTGLLAAFGTLGLPQAVARSLPYAADDNERRAIVRTAATTLIGSAILSTIALAAAGYALATFYGAPALGETLEAFSVGVGSAIASTLVISIFQGFEDVRPNVVFVQILNPASFFVLVFVLFRLTPTPLLFPEALAAYIAANALALAGLVLYARRRLPARLPPGPRAPGASRRLFLFATPLFLVSVAGFIAGNGDLLILGRFHYATVGSYSATLTLARLLQIGVGSLSYIFLPVATRFVRSNDRDGVQLTYSTATKWVALTSLPLFLLFFFFPVRTLDFVYGSGFVGPSFPLQVLVTGAILSTLAGPSVATQISYGQTRLLVYNAVVCALVDAGLAAALTPTYGSTGAAIAWATANALNPILSVVELAVFQGVHPFRRHYVVPVAVTGIPLGIALILFEFTPGDLLLPLLGLGFAGLYVLVVFLTGSLDHGDEMALEVVEKMLGRRFDRLRRLGAWRLRRRTL